MRISELAEVTGVPVATLKFYLRAGLVPAGEAVARTRAEYDAAHVDRVRLVRALTEVGGLDLARVARVLSVVDGAAPERERVLKEAQDALSSDRPATAEGHDEVVAWLAGRGWLVEPGSPSVDEMALALAACRAASVDVDERLDAYADACEAIARVDLDSVPQEPADAVRQVVLGTVLVDPLLVALRRLAQQHVARTEDPSLPPA